MESEPYPTTTAPSKMVSPSSSPSPLIAPLSQLVPNQSTMTSAFTSSSAEKVVKVANMPDPVIHRPDRNDDEDVPDDSDPLAHNQGLLDDLPSDSDDIDLTHSKIRTMKNLNLSRFKSLARLSFRQNLVTVIDAADECPTLTELDFYDNRILEVSGLEPLTAITCVFLP